MKLASSWAIARIHSYTPHTHTNRRMKRKLMFRNRFRMLSSVFGWIICDGLLYIVSPLAHVRSIVVYSGMCMWMMKNHMHRQQYGDDDVARKSDYEPLGLSTDKCNNRFISRTLRPMVYKWYMFVCVRMCIYLKLCVYLIRNLIQRCVQFSVSEKPPGEVDLLFAYSFSTDAFAIETH